MRQTYAIIIYIDNYSLMSLEMLNFSLLYFMDNFGKRPYVLMFLS